MVAFRLNDVIERLAYRRTSHESCIVPWYPAKSKRQRDNSRVVTGNVLTPKHNANFVHVIRSQSVPIVTGRLSAVSVDFFRPARYPTRRQTESHRAPRYRVSFQIEGLLPQEAVVGPNPPSHLVSTIRRSASGDIVEIVLSEDAGQILGWTNKTSDAQWHGIDTWGESD